MEYKEWSISPANPPGGRTPVTPCTAPFITGVQHGLQFIEPRVAALFDLNSNFFDWILRRARDPI
jgi:hypothetical protein